MGQETCTNRSFDENHAGGLLCHHQGCGIEENKGQRARVTTGKGKPSKMPAVAYDIEEWMQGLEGASNGEPK